MDYEREPDSELGATPSESVTRDATGMVADAADGTDHAVVAADPSVTPDAAPGEPSATDIPDTNNGALVTQAADDPQPDSDLGTDADVFDNSFASGLRPPEWPAADFVATGDDEESDVAMDAGDDSDAPIVDDAAPAATTSAATAPAAMDGHVRAENVNLSQGGVQSIEATTVTLSQGGAGRVRADEMNVEMGGVGLARVKTLKLGNGASAFAVIADEATVEEGSNAFLVLSRSLNGDVRPTIDWRGALAFGAGLGLILAIFRRLR